MGWRVGIACISVGVAESTTGMAREDHHGVVGRSRLMTEDDDFSGIEGLYYSFQMD